MPTNPHVLTAPDNISIAANGKTINLLKATEGVTVELQMCDLIGTAIGKDIFHCIYLAGRHAKNFTERVWCYTIKESDGNPDQVEVSFYELKKS